MIFMKIAGFGAEQTEEVKTALLEEALAFIYAGGRVTPESWALLDPQERAALVEARQRYDAASAYGLARAIRDEKYMNELLRRAGPEAAKLAAIAEVLSQKESPGAGGGPTT